MAGKVQWGRIPVDSSAGRGAIQEYHSWAMTKPSSLRYASQTWQSKLGKVHSPIPAVATQFELQVKRLGLTKQTYTASARLRAWCEDNKNQYYVPEWLLEEWEITVDAMAWSDVRARVA
jgi:hypothetical protein